VPATGMKIIVKEIVKKPGNRLENFISYLEEHKNLKSGEEGEEILKKIEKEFREL
jgi:hypothetical protein